MSPVSLLDGYPKDPAVCARLADGLVVVHSAIVLFVVLGEAAILLGGWRAWPWVKNRWLRVAHLATIAGVAIIAGLGKLCPLTVWEAELRRRAGQEQEMTSFVGRWLREFLYVDVPLWALSLSYVAFALLVVASLFWVPVRWRADSAPCPSIRGTQD